MNLLPQTYLLGLVGLLAVVAVLAGRQVLRVRGDEIKLIELERAGARQSSQAADLYELASVQLRKRLYPQATATLKQAVTPESGTRRSQGLIQNALGFALAAQKDYGEPFATEIGAARQEGLPGRAE